jgi:hypothetical protein
MIRKLFIGKLLSQEEVGEVSSDGVVYGGKGVHKEPIGFVDADGRVYKTDGNQRTYKGRVDLDGHIYTGEGALERKIGRVDAKGTVYGSPWGNAFPLGVETPIGQIRDDTLVSNPPLTLNLRDEILGDWRKTLFGENTSKPEPKPSRTLPEGAALLLLFQEKQ